MANIGQVAGCHLVKHLLSFLVFFGCACLHEDLSCMVGMAILIAWECCSKLRPARSCFSGRERHSRVLGFSGSQ